MQPVLSPISGVCLQVVEIFHVCDKKRAAAHILPRDIAERVVLHRAVTLLPKQSDSCVIGSVKEGRRSELLWLLEMLVIEREARPHEALIDIDTAAMPLSIKLKNDHVTVVTVGQPSLHFPDIRLKRDNRPSVLIF